MRNFVNGITILILLLSPQMIFASLNSDSVKHYYSYKNNAELYIVDSNYYAASKCYETAFQFKFPNGRDLYNAFVISYILKDSTSALKYFSLLAQQGQRRDYFEHTSFGAEIVKDDFYSHIAKSFDSSWNICQESDIPNLAAVIDQIEKIDQLNRSGSNYIKDDDIEYYKRVARSDEIARDSMYSFFKSYGFPGFKLVGVYPLCIAQVDVENVFWLLMWHARPNPTILDGIALQAVLHGEFPPDEYAFIMDERSFTYYEKLPRKVLELSSEKQIEIDSIRATIHLPPIKDYLKKLNYSKQDKRFLMFSQLIFGFNQF